MKSLAQALYFASRGIGHIRDNLDAEPIPYSSTARVVLSGLGSDELLGGYGRHRAVYTNGGWKAVVKEVRSFLFPGSRTIYNKTLATTRT